MAVYRNKKTGDLVDAWMHSKEEDAYQVAFPNWLHSIWEEGRAYTKDDGRDFVKTETKDLEVPDGAFIVRLAGGHLAVAAADDFRSAHTYED